MHRLTLIAAACTLSLAFAAAAHAERWDREDPARLAPAQRGDHDGWRRERWARVDAPRARFEAEAHVAEARRLAALRCQREVFRPYAAAPRAYAPAPRVLFQPRLPILPGLSVALPGVVLNLR